MTYCQISTAISADKLRVVIKKSSVASVYIRTGKGTVCLNQHLLLKFKVVVLNAVRKLFLRDLGNGNAILEETSVHDPSVSPDSVTAGNQEIDARNSVTERTSLNPHRQGFLVTKSAYPQLPDCSLCNPFHGQRPMRGSDNLTNIDFFYWLLMAVVHHDQCAACKADWRSVKAVHKRIRVKASIAYDIACLIIKRWRTPSCA
jgi:hypothetical protein